jgi:hypothetical protein
MRGIQSILAMTAGMAALGDTSRLAYTSNKPTERLRPELSSKQLKGRKRSKLAKIARRNNRK